jgi:signal transduction histidine kinase
MALTDQATSNVDVHSSNLLSLSEPAGSSLVEVTHDARNVMTALGVFCDLLEEPGVFAKPYRHYGGELRTVANANRGLVNRLLHLCGTATPNQLSPTGSSAAEETIEQPASGATVSKTDGYWNEVPPKPIHDFAWELQSNRHLLSALAGPSVTVSIDAVGGAQAVRLSGEDLTRILVNLVKNSVEAMSGSGGRIQFILRESQAGPDDEVKLLLNVEDNGPGIAPASLARIFEAGYTTRSQSDNPSAKTHAPHRGLGLSITRSIIEAAGGCIRAANRDPIGACIQIELPALQSK